MSKLSMEMPSKFAIVGRDVCNLLQIVSFPLVVDIEINLFDVEGWEQIVYYLTTH